MKPTDIIKIVSSLTGISAERIRRAPRTRDFSKPKPKQKNASEMRATRLVMLALYDRDTCSVNGFGWPIGYSKSESHIILKMARKDYKADPTFRAYAKRLYELLAENAA